ncbi:MAG: peptide-methionine (S)-S-oxide reductase MsrA [Chthoniobacterales bacterium]
MNSLFTSPTFAAKNDRIDSPTTAQAVLGGGCFWCMEALFQKLPGVLSVQSGFAGGTTKNPTYEKVCEGNTGHAEVIEITYDPKKISYNQLLDLFWRAHDPTTWNQQGADLGPQYRSVIFTTSPEQQQIAEASKKNAQAYFEKPIVTEIKPLTHFYPAEKYHQNYYLNNRNAPYCRAVIAPKLQKLHME